MSIASSDAQRETPPPSGASLLNPEHRAYLQARGLADGTITAAGLRSAQDGELPRLAGRPLPDGHTALLIPYPEGDGFYRLRFFPPLPDGDGREMRFLQRAGQPPRLYVPASVRAILADASKLVFVTESEIKALALTQAGFPAVGLGGVWTFRTKDLPPDGLIPDLEAVAWGGRLVYLVPDSDAWTNEHVKLAVYRLARLLEARGATVRVVWLHVLPGQAKTGVDDFLVAKGATEFGKLARRAISLAHSTWQRLRQQEKARGRTNGKSGAPPPELAGRRIHPALHFEEDSASVGILAPSPEGLAWRIITNTRAAYPAADLNGVLTCVPPIYADIAGRWPAEDLERFLAGDGNTATLGQVLQAATDELEAHIELGHEGESALLASWAVATYFHPLFLTFPRLDLRGEMGSGKSKVEAALTALSFNGLHRINPTPAVIFRLGEVLRPTLLLDEMEGLTGDDRREILALVNAGYKQGARIDRCEGDAHAVRSFEVYFPMALAGIAGLKRVTEDRALTVVMARGTDRTKLNREVDPQSPAFARIRAGCFRLALTRWQDVQRACVALKLPSWLTGRPRELWGPILTVATVAEQDGGPKIVPDLLALAREHVDERGTSLTPETEGLLGILADRLQNAETITVRPGELAERLQDCLNLRWPPSAEDVGRMLRRLDFRRLRKSRLGAEYEVTKAALGSLLDRYGLGGEMTVTPSQSQEPSQANPL